MQFSSRFKQLCKERNVTQKKALEDMGFHRNAAQRWSEGSPSTDALLKIADYFGLTTDEVLGVENKKIVSQSGDDSSYEFMKLFDQLTPEEQAREIAYLRELLTRKGM